jgi:hypothetical protein
LETSTSLAGQLPNSAKSITKLQKLEKNEHEDAMFVFLSDVWLDRANVLEKPAQTFVRILVPTSDLLCVHGQLFVFPIRRRADQGTQKSSQIFCRQP